MIDAVDVEVDVLNNAAGSMPDKGTNMETSANVQTSVKENQNLVKNAPVKETKADNLHAQLTRLNVTLSEDDWATITKFLNKAGIMNDIEKSSETGNHFAQLKSGIQKQL